MKDELKRLLYVAADYGPLVDRIHDAMHKKNVAMDVLFYDVLTPHNMLELPQYVKYGGVRKFYERGPLFYLSTLKRVANYGMRYARASGCSLLHGHMLFRDGIVCMEIGNKLGLDYVVSVRNTDMNNWFLWHLPWLRKTGIEVALRAKAIIFINRPHASLFLERMPMHIRDRIREKLAVIPNGVDDFWHENKGEERILEKQREISLLSVGRVEQNKNQETVAAATEILRGRGINVSYTNVGALTDQGIAKRLKRKHVTLIPNLPKEELIKRYRAADIFVLPSFTETFGLVYAEALTQGLPIIYSKGQGFDEQYEDGVVGFRVDSHNAHEIADCVLKIMDNYTDISRRGLEMSDVYTWDNVAEQFCRVYENFWNEICS